MRRGFGFARPRALWREGRRLGDVARTGLRDHGVMGSAPHAGGSRQMPSSSTDRGSSRSGGTTRRRTSRCLTSSHDGASRRYHQCARPTAGSRPLRMWCIRLFKGDPLPSALVGRTLRLVHSITDVDLPRTTMDGECIDVLRDQHDHPWIVDRRDQLAGAVDRLETVIDCAGEPTCPTCSSTTTSTATTWSSMTTATSSPSSTGTTLLAPASTTCGCSSTRLERPARGLRRAHLNPTHLSGMRWPAPCGTSRTRPRRSRSAEDRAVGFPAARSTRRGARPAVC